MQTIQANTFTPLYDEVEDRIRLIVNYQDFQNRIDFMITRRFMVKLIHSMQDFYSLYYDGIKKNQEQTIEKLVSKTQTEDISFYKKDEVLLLEVKLSFDDPFTIVEFKGKTVTAVSKVNAFVLDALIKNLIKSIPKYDWGLYF